MQCTLSLFLVVSVLVAFTAALNGDTFTVNCAPLTTQRSDPIVSPGVASGHVHVITGGNNFQRTMTGPNVASDATFTTCDKEKDHSNYWVPQLYHYANDQYELVPFRGSAHYYQKRACNYTAGLQYCPQGYTPRAFPYGFRMIAGDPFRRTQNNTDKAQKAVNMMCIYEGGSIEAPGFPTRRCNTIRAQVYFPSCWDGVNLDTANHKSHMAYPAVGDFNGGVCPQSHPVALLSLFFEFFFDTSSYTDINRFAFAMGDNTGYGFHGDFLMGWTDRDLLQTAHADCVASSNCPALGNQGQTPRALLVPAPVENIGLNGPIPTLPGNNPVTW